MPVTVKIPGSELALARKGGAEHTLIDFIGEVKDEYGTTIQNVRDKVDIKLSDETAAELAKRPIAIRHRLHAAAGQVHHQVSGARCRDRPDRNVHDHVRDSESEQGREADSDQLGGAEQPARGYDGMRCSTARQGQERQAANPLVQDGQKLIPSVTRVFSQEPRHVRLPAGVRARRQATTQPLVAFVTFYRGQTKAFETPPLPVTRRAWINSLKTVPLKFSLSLEKLPPGRVQLSGDGAGSDRAEGGVLAGSGDAGAVRLAERCASTQRRRGHGDKRRENS